jgi:hypothetical protein
MESDAPRRQREGKGDRLREKEKDRDRTSERPRIDHKSGDGKGMFRRPMNDQGQVKFLIKK